VREVTMKMAGLDPETVESWKHALVTVIYVSFSSITALFLDQLYKVVALTGALGGSMIEAIIPAAMWELKEG
jgi:hypothetical protein